MFSPQNFLKNTFESYQQSLQNPRFDLWKKIVEISSFRWCKKFLKHSHLKKKINKSPLVPPKILFFMLPKIFKKFTFGSLLKILNTFAYRFFQNSIKTSLGSNRKFLWNPRFRCCLKSLKVVFPETPYFRSSHKIL